MTFNPAQSEGTVLIASPYQMDPAVMANLAAQVKQQTGAAHVAFSPSVTIDQAELVEPQHNNGVFVRCSAIRVRISIVIGKNADNTKKSARGSLIITQDNLPDAWETLQKYALFLSGYSDGGVYYESLRWSQTDAGPRRNGTGAGFYLLVAEEGLVIARLGKTVDTGLVGRTQTPITSASFINFKLTSSVPQTVVGTIEKMDIQFDATGLGKNVQTLQPRAAVTKPVPAAAPVTATSAAMELYDTLF
jgi:hypothetical protein